MTVIGCSLSTPETGMMLHQFEKITDAYSKSEIALILSVLV